MKSLDEYYEGRYGVSWYDTLIDSFEVEVVRDFSDNDWQGDSYYLLKNGDKYGILVFGWGSCSGCDALQACESLEDFTDLRNSLWNAVKWMDEDEIKQYVRSKQWDADWYYYHEAGKEFIDFLKTTFVESVDV